MILFKCTVAFATAIHVLEAAADNIGQWESTIQFPLVPVAATVQPPNFETGKLLVWSADENLDFSPNGTMTLTATYDLATENVSALTVSNTNHDMFCPGISKDFNGRVVVTGGNAAARTSIYDPNSNTWISAPNMTIPRGYQSSTIVSDGQIFTIGGSWSGDMGGKNGEIYNPASNTWSLLPGCPVAPMLTADVAGVYRADNHGWLFGWKEGSVFQAGPSKAMNWYGTSGNGSTQPAGTRGNDSDAMCGVAVMYDAVAGKILAAGGSPSYENVSATTNAHIITIDDLFTDATTEEINPMWEPRAFANAVVLPDGKVFITGGQSYPVPFSDDNSSMVPELWDPDTTKFVQMARLPTPRNYHSVALLMPDATVFNGGGGLCGSDCNTNHLDGQFFHPPYLFEDDGVTRAQRPTISSVSCQSPKVSETIIITVTDIDETCKEDPDFSLIRIGTSTHTVDTDQRRVPLCPEDSDSDGNYILPLPTDPGVLMPGYWYLFAIACGVPSEAETILVAP
ncbi:copper radical oxidase [Elaphomyces granulatus]